MYNDIEEVLFSEEQLKKRIKELAGDICRDYQNKELVMIAVLRGAVIFFADLAREMDIPVTLDFMVVTRYGTKDYPGDVKILKDLDVKIENRHVLIVEDVIDNGDTIFYLLQLLKLRKPTSLKICTLFDKPLKRKAQVYPDYKGFELPDRFVVGFGLDYKQKYRNLPFLTTLKPGVCLMDES